MMYAQHTVKTKPKPKPFRVCLQAAHQHNSFGLELQPLVKSRTGD
jgi:hypothetical protein